MKRYFLFYSLFILLHFSFNSLGNHVVGGHLSMKQIDNVPGKYKITVTLLINVDHFEPDEEDLMKTEINYVRVIRKSDNRFMPMPVLGFEKFENLIYDNTACEHLNSLHTRQYTYAGNIQWNIDEFNDAGGYYLAYERCCRDKNITNIESPGESGMTLYLEFPSLQRYPQFSSPEFSVMKGDYICSGKSFNFDLGVKDPDNDILKFSIVTPWKGRSLPNMPRPTAEEGPYDAIVWKSGYSETNAIEGSPTLMVDQTGQLSVKASKTGLFIFTVRIEKYRNDELIGLFRCDLQFLVTNCSSKTPPMPVITQNNNPVTTVEICGGGIVSLETQYGTDWAYQWQKDGKNIPDAKFSTLNVNEPGKYSVVKSYKTECANDINAETVDVSTGTGNNVSFDPVPPVCSQDKIILNALPPGGTFTGPGVTNNAFDPSVAGVGSHQITYSTGGQSGCAASKSITIEVKPIISLGLPDEIRAKPNEVIVIPTDPSQTDLIFSWSPSKGLSNQNIATPSVTVTDNITYTVIAKSPDGCQIKDEVKIITDVRLIISNAFTPDGDGLNDFWVIKGIEDFPDCEIFVYNTWGELIFYSKGYTTNWDGKYKGKEVQGGMYLYKIDTKSNNKVFQGYLSIIY